jgi:hypothetical protein
MSPIPRDWSKVKFSPSTSRLLFLSLLLTHTLLRLRSFKLLLAGTATVAVAFLFAADVTPAIPADLWLIVGKK